MIDNIPSILMVSWNRREYYERTMPHLLADSSDFRLHLWDNGSEDGLADYIADLKDDRIVERHMHPVNVGQYEPWHWFVKGCKTDIGGKLDDDILGETGWMTRFANMLVAEPQLGLLGAWVFMPEEWDATVAAHKIRHVGDYEIFHTLRVPGGIFLGRIETLRRFSLHDPQGQGVPLDNKAITRAGLLSGYPLPMSFAHHQDDPRSPYCRMNRPGGWDQFAAYTARMRKFSGPDEYGKWIARDARSILETSVADQLNLLEPPTSIERIKRKLKRLWGRPAA